MADEWAATVEQQIAQVDSALTKLTLPFRHFPLVEDWEETFLWVDFRWKILVLNADSVSGKSTFAESRFDNPLVITVEDAVNLDLKDFTRKNFRCFGKNIFQTLREFYLTDYSRFVTV